MELNSLEKTIKIIITSCMGKKIAYYVILRNLLNSNKNFKVQFFFFIL